MDTSNLRSLKTLLVAVAAAGWLLGCATGAQAAGCPALLDRTVPRLQDEKPQNLCQYSGKVVLVVNTASLCGFTSQYQGLEALYARFHDRGLVVLGFPSNDFGSQEPGSNAEIAAFCASSFGVKFPMFTKTRVSNSAGAEVHPLYAELRRVTGSAPGWNFHKYVIARDGKTVESHSALTAPDNKAFIDRLEKLLAAR